MPPARRCRGPTMTKLGNGRGRAATRRSASAPARPGSSGPLRRRRPRARRQPRRPSFASCPGCSRLHRAPLLLVCLVSNAASPSPKLHRLPRTIPHKPRAWRALHAPRRSPGPALEFPCEDRFGTKEITPRTAHSNSTHSMCAVAPAYARLCTRAPDGEPDGGGAGIRCAPSVYDAGAAKRLIVHCHHLH